MNIVFITPWYGMFAGGLEAEFRCYAEILVSLGFGVEVLTTCSQSPYHSWQEDYFTPGQEVLNGVIIRRFRTNKKHRNKYLFAEQSALNNPSLALQYDFFKYGIGSDELVNFISQYDDQSILIVGPYFQALSYLVLMAYPNRIYLRTALHHEPQVTWQPVADMLQAAKGYLLATEAEKDLAIYFHGLTLGFKIIETPVIGVPVQLPKLMNSLMPAAIAGESSYDNHIESIRAHYHLPKNYYVYVGRKEVGKGVVKLVKWYQHYLEECQQKQETPAPLVFLGGGEQHLIPKHDCFLDLGFVPEEHKHALVATALGLINLSANESFSLVLMEAWAQSTPVIVFSGCAVTTEHCQKSGGGIEVDSAFTFSLALRTMLDQKLQKAMGVAGRNYLLKHYPLSKVINDFLCLVNAEVTV